MNPLDMGKLNVGRNRSAREALDVILMREALEALKQTYIHCEELRDAWERGALDEHDGKGGTRSNRNYTVVLAVRASITKLEQRLLRE